ncbi:MAG TPA: transcription antitermination factor NusB [Candidatus Saccharimonadales bacterium]|nr:transcription antitermination factor NusB [Candidatus Saccharimonadales bacterium]
MKSAKDPRHILRRKIIKELFASSYVEQASSQKTKDILRDLIKIDKQIEKAAPEWPVDKINRIDLAILRLAVWEIKQEKISKKVVIDEAIELAKEYGTEASPAFINGVLGNIVGEK